MGPRVLTYHRPWNSAFFSHLASVAFPRSKLRLTTDYVGYEGDGLGVVLRDTYRSRPDDGEWYDEDVVFRSRLLRLLPADEVARFLSATRRAVTTVLEDSQPDLVLAQTVDSHVLDLLRLESARLRIPYLGLIPSPVNGFVFITARGEHLKFREVEDSEIASAYEQFSSTNYRPYYTGQAPWRRPYQLARMLRTQMRRPLSHARARLRSDPLNHHYLGARKLGKELGRPRSLPRASYFERDWKEVVQRQQQLVGYLPLQVWPEANSEYWLQYRDFMPYLEGVLLAIRGLGDAVVVMVKEHPQILGIRQPWFIRALRQARNVILVPPSTPSRQLISVADFVMVWSGSAGLEAAIAGKPVLDFGGTYLTDHSAATRINSTKSLGATAESLPRRIRLGGLDTNQRLDFMHRTLSGYLPGRVYLGRGFSSVTQGEKEMVEQLGESIQATYPRWKRLAAAKDA